MVPMAAAETAKEENLAAGPLLAPGSILPLPVSHPHVLAAENGGRTRRARTRRGQENSLSYPDLTDTDARRISVLDRALVDSLPVGSFVLSPRGRYLRVNAAYCALSGYSEEELSERLVFDLHPDRDLDRWEREWNEAHAGATIRRETRLRTRSGALVPIEFVAAGVVFEGERYLVGHAHGIAERERASRELRDSEERLRVLIEESPLGILIVDATARITVVNSRVEHMFGYPRGEMLGRKLDMLLPNYPLRAGLLSETSGLQWTGMGWRRDGTEFTAEVWSGAVLSVGQRDEVISLTLSDITDRVRLEKRMARSVSQTETLLKEVHHRVKNNLQMICSILSLQASGAMDEHARAVFNEVSGRVQSMAMIHERLYQSPTFAQIELGEYAGDLARMLVHAYAATAIDVRVELNAVPVIVGVDEAVPLALILNELISNSLKHGLRQRNQGCLRIEIRPDGEHYEVAVADDGAGLPVEFDWTRARSLGLEIVRVLTRQLRGEILARPGPAGGTEFRLRLPLPHLGANLCEEV